MTYSQFLGKSNEYTSGKTLCNFSVFVYIFREHSSKMSETRCILIFHSQISVSIHQCTGSFLLTTLLRKPRRNMKAYAGIFDFYPEELSCIRGVLSSSHRTTHCHLPPLLDGPLPRKTSLTVRTVHQRKEQVRTSVRKGSSAPPSKQTR